MIDRQQKAPRPKDPEEMWKEAFPDPKPATHSFRAVILGSEIGAVIGALLSGGAFLRFLESRYARSILELANAESGIGLFILGCLPGLLVGGLVGAFLGSRIKPRD